MFERFANGRRPDWKRRTVLVGSLALHGGVVVALLVASWFHVAELTPPALAVVFLSAPEPPPPPAAPPRSRPHPATHRPQPSVPAVAAPAAPPPSQPDPGDLPSDGPPGPPGPPDPSGLPGDPHGAPCTGGNCVSAPAPKPRNVAPHALDAQRIAGAMPHLPPAVIGARRGLGDSTFTARICVDQAGAVSSVTVLAGIPGADGDIVSTLRGWRYKPQPIPVCFITQFVYDVQ